MPALIDTGAEANVIFKGVLLPGHPVYPSPVTLTSFNGKRDRGCGETCATPQPAAGDGLDLEYPPGHFYVSRDASPSHYQVILGMPWLTRVFAAIQLAPSSGDLVARDFWGHTEGETWLDVRGKARDGTPQVARWYGVSQDPRSIKVISASTVDGAPACIMPQGPLCHSAPQLGPVKVTPDGPADELREYEQLCADADASRSTVYCETK